MVAKRADENGLLPAQLKAERRYRKPVARLSPTSLKNIGGRDPPLTGVTGVVSLVKRPDEFVRFTIGKSMSSNRDHMTTSEVNERVLVSNIARWS